MKVNQEYSNLSSLAETYYQLREASHLDLAEKFAIASEVIKGYQEQDLYFYRRSVDKRILQEGHSPNKARK